MKDETTNDELLEFMKEQAEKADRQFRGIDQRFDGIDDRLGLFGSRFDAVDEQLDRIESRLQGANNNRIDDLAYKVAPFTDDFLARFRALEDKVAELMAEK